MRCDPAEAKGLGVGSGQKIVRTLKAEFLEMYHQAATRPPA